MLHYKKQTGFTLIELIITIVVIGIMVMGIAGFIELGTKGYADTVDRQQLQNQARFVVEKLTREIRHAVPNSFSVFNNGTGECLSFYPIDYSGAYVMLEQGEGVSDRFRFVIVNSISSPGANNLENKKMVINPATPDDLDTANSNQSIVLSGVAKDESNDFYSIEFDEEFNSGNVVPSPASRLYIYSHQVTYCQQGTQLTRQIDTQAPIQVGEDVELADFADGTADGEDALSRSALIHLRLLFLRGDERSNYENDVQVLNVP
ncbi:prepilin-type N-terminal cleavage/methylation domain-containing protein [Vibrio sp. CK2-1]|uniref:PilW family protein n=1 Tax=Vibrio sp. CK2-1 TaxID=2912249 RepID=UPI001F381B65|nr:prepilin-type N-terminal cleavage/methylation domain-containing protein [Vibrio sp. CK2-1]MCF7353831.1 prepilin-type N-terminal cleavage/methylation domain-containing protein [Vibrio sp. CK2-1]